MDADQCRTCCHACEIGTASRASTTGHLPQRAAGRSGRPSKSGDVTSRWPRRELQHVQLHPLEPNGRHRLRPPRGHPPRAPPQSQTHTLPALVHIPLATCPAAMTSSKHAHTEVRPCLIAQAWGAPGRPAPPRRRRRTPAPRPARRRRAARGRRPRSAAAPGPPPWPCPGCRACAHARAGFPTPPEKHTSALDGRRAVLC